MVNTISNSYGLLVLEFIVHLNMRVVPFLQPHPTAVYPPKMTPLLGCPALLLLESQNTIWYKLQYFNGMKNCLLSNKSTITRDM